MKAQYTCIDDLHARGTVPSLPHPIRPSACLGAKSAVRYKRQLNTSEKENEPAYSLVPAVVALFFCVRRR